MWPLPLLPAPRPALLVHVLAPLPLLLLVRQLLLLRQLLERRALGGTAQSLACVPLLPLPPLLPLTMLPAPRPALLVHVLVPLHVPLLLLVRQLLLLR